MACCYKLLNRIKKPDEIKNSDEFSVFLKQKRRDYKNNTVLPGAFEPRFNSDNSRLETSCFRINQLSKSDILKLGYLWTVLNYWPRKSGQSSIKGYAKFDLALIKSTNQLKLEMNPSPHPRHCDIVEWDASLASNELHLLELSIKAVPVFK